MHQQEDIFETEYCPMSVNFNDIFEQDNLFDLTSQSAYRPIKVIKQLTQQQNQLKSLLCESYGLHQQLADFNFSSQSEPCHEWMMQTTVGNNELAVDSLSNSRKCQFKAEFGDCELASMNMTSVCTAQINPGSPITKSADFSDAFERIGRFEQEEI